MSGIIGSKLNIRGSGLVGSLGTDGQHLLSAGAGVSNVFETVAAGGSTPGFQAYKSSTTGSIADNSFVKVACDTETYDSAGTYDNSTNYRWTPGTDAKYFVYGQLFINGDDGLYNMYLSVYKNGTAALTHTWDDNTDDVDQLTMKVFGILALDADDYVELFAKVDVVSGSNNHNGSGILETHFGGFKVG